MARSSVVAGPLPILPPPPSRFCPLALYCPLSWHLTAYTSLLASTLLQLTGWHPTAAHLLAPYCPVAPLAPLSSPIVAILLGYAQPCHCTASVAAAKRLGRTM